MADSSSVTDVASYTEASSEGGGVACASTREGRGAGGRHGAGQGSAAGDPTFSAYPEEGAMTSYALFYAIKLKMRFCF